MIKTSAPGKIHISGEHSVVYGYKALLTSIDKRVYITLKPRQDEKIILQDLKLKHTQTLSFANIRRFSCLNPFTFKSQDKLGLVKKAIDKTYSFLQKKPDKGFVIKINSQIPIGQGLGSSAALATSLTAAILLLEEKKLDKEKINKISHETETAQHGNASGSDTTISCYGGFLIFQKKDDKLTFKSLKTASFFQKLMLLNSGQPKESTAQMVGLADKQKNKKVFADIGKITKEIIKTLKQKDVFKLKKLIIKNQKLLEDLGVVGSKAKKIIKLIEKQGGAGKICGAGGIKKGSGMILAFHPQPKNLKKTLNKKNIKHLNIKINQPGVRQEK